MIRQLDYRLHDLLPYINWLYFFHAWGMPPRFAGIAEVHQCVACRKAWVNHHEAGDRDQAVEAERLFLDAVDLLRGLDGAYSVRAVFGLFPAWSEGDDIVVSVTDQDGAEWKSPSAAMLKVDTIRLPFLRQQGNHNPEKPFLCLSDFVAPYGYYYAQQEECAISELKRMPHGTVLGAFASAVDPAMEQLFSDDDYRRMLLQTLCDRLAEAAAEKMHEEVRKTYWGYAPQERFSPKDLFNERYQGKRPAVGYPSIPDQSINFLICRLVGMDKIGIQLTSNGMMQPHAAVSGLMFDHPAACHFSVGAIGADQLQDYASRRQLPVSECRRFLSRNLRKTSTEI